MVAPQYSILAQSFLEFDGFRASINSPKFQTRSEKFQSQQHTVEGEQEMRKRSTRKSSAAVLLATPLAPPSTAAPGKRSRSLSPAESPAVKFDFNLDGLAEIASALKKKKSNKNGSAVASNSKRMQPTGFSNSPPRSLKSVNTISDLKDLASSNLESIKRQLELSHSEILKDIEASESRLQKRFKIQTQACQQVIDEAEKEYKKIFERINEGREAMKFVKHPSPSLQKLQRKALLYLGVDLGSHQMLLEVAESSTMAFFIPVISLEMEITIHWWWLSDVILEGDKLRSISTNHLSTHVPKRELSWRVMGIITLARTPPLPLPPSLTSSKYRTHVLIHSSTQSKSFKHVGSISATLNSPKGFGPKPNKIKNSKKLKKNKYESQEEDEEEEEDDREEGVIPEIVTNRMISRMGFSVGIPLFIGLLFFPFFYYLKVGLKIDVPTWVPFIVSFVFFGAALLGVSYGIVSASWEPLREGSLLGWNEARKNWPVFWGSIWGGSKNKS
ncbi:ABC-type Co2+ transport system, partial [Striga asiatica]